MTNHPNRIKREVRYVVVREWFTEETGNYTTDQVPVLYGTEAEAKACMDRLNAGGDIGFHEPGNGRLEVQEITIDPRFLRPSQY